MEVEDEFLKTEVPTVVMNHTSFKHCEAEECGYRWNPKYMEPPHNMLFRMHCYRLGWDPKKTEILQAKIPIKCLLLHSKHGLPAENCPWCQAQTPVHGQLLFSEFDA